MQRTERKVVERSILKKEVVEALSVGRHGLIAGILATLIAGAYGTHVAKEVREARSVITAMKADEGVPHNLVTAMKADEGVPHNLVTA